MVSETAKNADFIHKDITNTIKRFKRGFGFRTLAIIAALLVLISTSLFLSFILRYYSNRILAGININGVEYGNLTVHDATTQLNENLKNELVLKVIVSGKTNEIRADDISFKYSVDETIMSAYEVGHSGNVIDDLRSIFQLYFTKRNLDLVYSYDANELNLVVSDIKLNSTDRFSEPYYIYENNKLSVIEGKTGLDFNSQELQESIINSFASRINQDINVSTYTSNPSLSKTDLESKINEVNQIINKKIKLTSSDYEKEFSKEEIVQFIKISKSSDNNVLIEANMQSILKSVQTIALEIDREPSGQILKIENDRVVDFKPSLDGIRVKLKENTENIKTAMFSDENEVKSEIALEKTTAPSPDGNDYGIKELLGVGKSKFVGSIPSRIHNVGLASERVTGILVAPGETFSFNKAVGEVSRKTGYKSAYVISGGRTVLGDGGGLCQVSTTVFRAALDAGLKIVARSPHSYRVGYYEQDSGPGIDATVYSPSVDFKFLNDTEHHILIVSEFNAKNSTLKYSIYGTNDGRSVDVGEPKILSKKAPPATIYEDDPSLPKGTKKQVEHAVAGAVVEFTRKVTKDGEVMYDDVFKSNYRAWPSVIKVGTAE